MRKVTFGGANSLDNYLARPGHEVDSVGAKSVAEKCARKTEGQFILFRI
jgi:hypothetical protein